MSALRRERIGAMAAGLCVAVLLAGCAAPKPAPKPVPSPNPRLAPLLGERDRALQSLRSLARISYRTKNQRGSFDAAVLVRRPHRLRLEAFSIVGAALILTVDDGQVTGFLPSEARFYRAKTSRENLYRATQMFLELDEMVALMMGLPPVDSKAGWNAGALELRRVRADRSTDILTFDENGTAPIRWQRLGPNGESWYVAKFEEYSETAFGRFPLKITLETPPLQRTYEIRYDKPEINITLPEAHFVQDLPEGVVRVPLPTPTG